MKGIIFTEFLDFVELQSCYETVDAMLIEAAPASGGAYTAVGNYDFAEMGALLTVLSQRLGQPVPDILQAFGKHLFTRYVSIYPLFFQDCDDSLDFLSTIEHRIHTEVLKLYPDAQLPHLRPERISNDCLILSYRSSRPLGPLCLGVIEGCGEYFDEKLDVHSRPVEDGLDITICRNGAPPAYTVSKAEALS